MHAVLIFFHVFIAMSLIGLVLIQHGKGAETGASFGGGGASQTIFGSRGSTPFLIKITTLLGALFFATSLTLGYFSAAQTPPENTSLLGSIASEKPVTQGPNIPLPDDLPKH